MRVSSLLAAGLLLASLRAAAIGDPFADCEHQVRTRGKDLESWRCFAVVAQRQNALAEGIRRLERHTVTQRDEMSARLVLGQLKLLQGDRQGGEALIRAALEGFERQENGPGAVEARIALANLLAATGRFPEAERVTAGAVERVKDLDRTLRARVRLMEGYLARRKGDYGRAWLVLREIEPDLFPDGPPTTRGLWLQNMGYIAWATGRSEEGLGFYRRQAELLKGAGDRFHESVVLGDIVLLLGNAGGRRAERRQLAREALDAAVASGNKEAESRAHFYLAETTEGTEALDHAREALTFARRTVDGGDLQASLRAAAHLTWHVANDPAAWDLIAEAVARAKESGNLEEEARDKVVSSRMRWERGPREDAIRDSLSALAAIEATRDLQPDSLTRAARFAQWGGAYHELAGHLLAGDLRGNEGALPEDLDLALATTERMRARTLLDQLDASQASAAVLSSGPLEKQRDDALVGIARIQKRLLERTISADERSALLKELYRAEIEESTLRSRVENANPTFAAIRHPVHPTIRQLQSMLNEDEAILSFQLSRDTLDEGWIFAGGSWILTITRKGTSVHRLPDESLLEEPVRLFLGLCEGREGTESAGAARLYRDLLAHAVGDLPQSIKRLVIVPDHVLNRLPFGILRRSASEPPLADTYEITTVPSATLWWRWKGTPSSPAESPALALADPAFVRVSSGAPALPPERAWALSTAAALSPLRAARDEGRSVVSRLGSGSRLLVGVEASEAFVKRAELSRYRVVHFATHALLDDEHPERSAILLAPGDAGEDGLLQLREIVKLDLKGRLVVLSGCRSASGWFLRGEGVVGLARAFFQAGASAVVGSLWPLRDDDAAAFFDRFYAHLAKGKTVAGAVRDAQRDRIRAGAPAQAWAGIVALGNGGSVPFPRAAMPWPWVVAGAILAAAGFAAFRYRSGR